MTNWCVSHVVTPVSKSFRMRNVCVMLRDLYDLLMSNIILQGFYKSVPFFKLLPLLNSGLCFNCHGLFKSKRRDILQGRLKEIVGWQTFLWSRQHQHNYIHSDPFTTSSCCQPYIYVDTEHKCNKRDKFRHYEKSSSIKSLKRS